METSPAASKAPRRCFANARVRTLCDRQPLAQAVATEGERILAVGSNADCRSAAGPAAEEIDLGGRLVLPGFIDSHTHLVQGGRHLAGLDLRHCRTTGEFSRAIATYASAHRGEWVTGGDWDHEAWERKQLPRREWIDEATVDTPVYVQRFDGHMALANTAALRLAGVTAATADPPGGSIERDPGTGEPTGILRDTAMLLVHERVPRPTAGEHERAAVRAMEEAARNGITTVHDITLPDHLPVFQKLERERRLTVRVYTRLPLSGYGALVGEGISRGHGSAWLKVGSLKAFADGSLGSSTAWFFDPYAGEPGNRGLAMDVLADGRLRAWALDADRRRLQLSIHAIGDRANAETLRLFEEIARTNPPWDRRFRIEHAQHVRREDVARFRALGVVVSAQPYHCIDDGVWAERRIGKARLATTYPFRTFMDAGVTVCFGSDWTVAPLDPVAGIYAAVTRRTLDGRNPEGWVPEQKISVAQAVRGYTVNAAYAAFEENVKGSIEPGKYADLVVLGEDLFETAPDRLREARVQMTVAGGAIVYRA